MNLFWDPLHQAPCAPLYGFNSQPSDLFLRGEWVSMEEEGLIGECKYISHKKDAMSWERRGCETGRVSLFLCLDEK
jgi:hypothetical protein